jgi:hypothetical protein
MTGCCYEAMTPTAVERAMKLQDVILRATAKRIAWYQTAEIGEQLPADAAVAHAV